MLKRRLLLGCVKATPPMNAIGWHEDVVLVQCENSCSPRRWGPATPPASHIASDIDSSPPHGPRWGARTPSNKSAARIAISAPCSSLGRRTHVSLASGASSVGVAVRRRLRASKRGQQFAVPPAPERLLQQKGKGRNWLANRWLCLQTPLALAGTANTYNGLAGSAKLKSERQTPEP